MVARLPQIEILLPPDPEHQASVTWNGDPIEAESVEVDENGDPTVVIAGVTYNKDNAEIHARQDRI